MTKYKDEWIKLSEIQEVYEDISINTIRTLVSNYRKEGKDTSWYKTFEGIDSSFIFVNVGYFKYVWERRRHIQFASQEMYWKLIDKYKNDWAIAKRFAKYCNSSVKSVNMFLSNRLFANTYNISLTNLKIAKRYIDFYNFCLNELEPIVFDSIDEECDYNEAKRRVKCQNNTYKEK